MQNHVISKEKKWIKKWRVVVLRISWHFCGWFEKHSMGKHKENLRTVYNLFDHWNMALSSDFRHLKTLLATKLVFHSVLKMAACCSRSVPAATKCCCVLKQSWPRTSGAAMWSSLIVAGPYFLAFLSGAYHLVSRCVAQHLSLIHIWRCRRSTLCRSRWSPYH